MPWFQSLCRNLGLAVHHATKPVADTRKQTVRQTVEEQPINETTTLRRTTIEEIEIAPTPEHQNTEN